ncbi:aminotransferase A [Fictibacillus sp. KU28468]|uniref:aminotransferase A n=1 Tax=Fictibacillus sp. KU28468 TaxID=2991053 RepID=UPI00223DD586|nr:aminotransferase A [Fictibacillus sp. KU28468]UZJ80544.1 aminotransferase A [Fictibacillus sp. KU28468]
MKHLVNKRVKKLEVTGIRKFSNMLVDYPEAINLTLGQPDFHTPDHIKNIGISAIIENKTDYTMNAGLLELRTAVSNIMYDKYRLAYNPENEIIITNGASEAIDTAFRTILEEGCEVILPAPTYPGYEPLIELCGAVPVYLDTSKNGFLLTAEMIEKHVTKKTRCIVLTYPSNPTGKVIGEGELEKIARLLIDKEIFVISDEIYSELVYDGSHHSIASYSSLRAKNIVVNGISKSHSMTGWRIGYVCAPSYLAEEMLKVHMYNSVCASSISQYAAIEALTNGTNDPLEMRKEYKKRRDYMYERLVNMGFDVVKPDGAFYLFPSIKKWNMKSFDFAMQLLQSEGVGVVPGDAFTPFGEGFIRISFANSLQQLEEGLNRIERFVKNKKINRVNIPKGLVPKNRIE